MSITPPGTAPHGTTPHGATRRGTAPVGAAGAMTRVDVFRDLVAILESCAPDVDTRAVELDDTPFADHGIDSMTLLRLVGDVEKKFSITIGDADALIAFSFLRLVELIETKRQEGMPPEQHEENFLATVERRAAAAGPAATLRFVARGQDDVVLTSERFLRIAAGLSRHLPANGSGPQTVLVAATEPLTVLAAFVAALGRGAQPLVLPTPKSMGGMPAYLDRIHRLVGRFAGGVTVALEPGLVADRAALPDVPVLELPADVAAYPDAAELPPASERTARGDDIAFLQMTSASTGDAKLVAISHRNVCANLTALQASLRMTEGDDRTFSWLPLYHDMGLVGGALFPLYQGISTVIMKPTDFVRDPARWLRGVSEYRCTFTGAPSFGLDYAASVISDDDLEGVDLSHVRRVGVAAEPIHRDALQKFVDRFAPYGFRADSVVPGLGLAESTLATTTSVDKAPRYLVVASTGAVVGEPVRVLGRSRVTHPAEPEPDTDVPGVAVFGLGVPLAGLTVEILDDDGAVIDEEGVLGEIAVRGSSVSAGYYEPERRALEPRAGDTLLTGDLGFLEGGELFVLERKKNVIIRRGANFLASLLEQRIAEILRVPAFSVIVVEADVLRPDSDIHVVVENAQDLPEPDDLQRRALRRLDLPVDVLTFARGFAIPRTTSGKKRYHVCRQVIAADELADDVRHYDLRKPR
jgi:acyl-CoA synthetase (AMP-forming)/AMP-acid ligase II/acyl carrier protein